LRVQAEAGVADMGDLRKRKWTFHEMLFS
jgi:hypothetical protein